MMENPHHPECDGNGVIDCWACGGEGTVEVPDDDMTDMTVDCDICHGKGYFECKGCAEEHPPTVRT